MAVPPCSCCGELGGFGFGVEGFGVSCLIGVWALGLGVEGLGSVALSQPHAFGRRLNSEGFWD